MNGRSWLCVLTIIAGIGLGGVVFQPSAFAAPVSWSLSASATEPFANTGSPAPGVTVVYLWLVCESGQGGISQAQFGLTGSGSVTSYQPANGFSNVDLLGDYHLLVSGCPTGPILAGSFTVNDPSGSGFNLCFSANTLGTNNSTICGAGAVPNATVGFASDGTTPCASVAGSCAAADLAITSTVDNATPRELVPFTWTVTVTNDGPFTLANVSVVNVAAPALILDSHSATQGSFNSTSGVWTLTSFADQESADLELVFRAPPGSEGSILTNHASSTGSPLGDPDSSNNADSSTITIDPPLRADLVLTATSDRSFGCEGDSATFVARVRNDGPDASSGFAVLCTLTPGLTAAQHTASHGSFDEETRTWTVGALAAAEEATLSTMATIGVGTGGMTLWSAASVVDSNEEDPLAGNEADSASISIPLPEVTGTIEAATTVPGSAATLRVNLQNDSDVADVSLLYRSGGSPGFVTLPMAPGSPGAWEATVPSSEVSRAGIQWFALVSSSCATIRIPAVDYAFAPARIDADMSLVIPAGEYVMLGVPLEADDPSPLAVFDELAPYDPYRWRYGTWNGSGYGDGPESARDAVAGQGFWIFSIDSAPIQTSGWSSSLAEDWQVQLFPGWNQIANPFSFPIDFSQLVRSAGVGDDLVSYEGTAYHHFQSTLVPGRGYWLRNESASSATVTFPVGPLPSPANSPSRFEISTEQDWSIELTAVSGDARDSQNMFGMRWGSLDQSEDDYPEAPLPPANGLVASFKDRAGRSMQTDFRSPGGEGAVWTFAIESTGQQPVWIKSHLKGTRPSGWQFVGVNRADGSVVDLEEETPLKWSPQSIGHPEWQLIAGTPEFVHAGLEHLQIPIGMPAGIQLTIAPNPTSQGPVEIRLVIPVAGPAKLGIYDLAGRLIQNLTNGTLAAGTHRLIWNGRDREGEWTAAGIYFARCETADNTALSKIVRVFR